MRIIFMGTPDFAKVSLEALYGAGNEIVAVVTNPDKPQGRGMKEIASPVKEYALEKNLKVYQPLKVRNNEEFIQEIKAFEPDLLCVVAYGKILPKELLDIPKYGAINVHGSLLPKYRGAAPIQWAVLNGDKETGITTMFMDEGMDTGDMILKERVQIGDDETTGELWERLSNIGARLLTNTVRKIEKIVSENQEINNMAKQIEKYSNNLEREASKEDSVELEKIDEIKNAINKKIKDLIGAEKQGQDFTVAPMLNKEMAKIDWEKSAKEIKNLVRGLNPIMGAYSYLNDKKIKLWKVEVLALDSKFKYAQNGEIVTANKQDGMRIKVKDGIISVLEIQGENSKKMDIKSFLNGNKIEEGTVLKYK